MKLINEEKFKTYKNHRQEPYFTFLKNGQKTIEGRINKKLYKEVVPGDHIVVYNSEETDSVEVKVLARREYSSFKEMLETEEIKKVLPDAGELDAAVKVYKSIYSVEQEQEFGVVAIEVEVVC